MGEAQIAGADDGDARESSGRVHMAHPWLVEVLLKQANMRWWRSRFRLR
jgi:hypothetical protein